MDKYLRREIISRSGRKNKNDGKGLMKSDAEGLNQVAVIEMWTWK